MITDSVNLRHVSKSNNITQGIFIVFLLLIVFNLCQVGYFTIPDDMNDQLFHPNHELVSVWIGRIATASAVLLVAIGLANKIYPSPPITVLLAINAYMLLTCVWAPNSIESAISLVRSGTYIYAGHVISRKLTTSNRALGIALGVILFGSISIFLITTDPRFATTGTVSGWRGCFSHKNGLASFCAFSIIGLVWSWPDARHKYTKLIAFVISAILLAGSSGKTGMAIAASFPFLLVVAQWLDRRVRFGVTILLISGWAVAVLLFTWSYFIIPGEITLTGRTRIWSFFWSLSQQNLGMGRGGLPLQDREVQIMGWQWVGQVHPHNSVITIILSIGLVGLVFYATYLFITVWWASEARTRRAGLAGLLAVIAYVGYGEAESYYNLMASFPLLITILLLPHERSAAHSHGSPISLRNIPFKAPQLLWK